MKVSSEEISRSLIPWPAPGNLLPEQSRRQLAVLSENPAVRTLGSGFLFLAGTLAMAMFLLTAEKHPARGAAAADDSGIGDVQPYASDDSSANGFLALAAEMESLAPADPESLATPFFYARGGLDRANAVDCLATAAWYEAGDDPEGQRSVMQVVLNRVRHPSFPKSVCGVVFQGSERITGCQFSFTCDGSMQRRRPSAAQWARAKVQSERALSGDVDDSVRTATHFHADYVAPWWRSQLEKVGQVGAHIFYRWRGDQSTMARRNVITEAEVAPVTFALGGAPRMMAESIAPGAELAGDDRRLLFAPLAESGTVAAAPVTHSVPGRKVVEFAASGPSGRWAVDSMKMCAGQKDCRVVGFASSWQADANRSRAAAAMDRPLFVFARDSVSGMDVALWDCDRVQRNLAKECLPGDKAAVTRLIEMR